MSTPSSSFKVFPENEITFNYSPKKHLNSSIYLTSTSDQLLAFKVKTNVPICYVVKPHIGFLSPHSSIEISIIMQPTDYTPQTAAIADKFLINAVPLPNDTDMAALSDPTLFQKLWDSVPKSLVESAKLKVTLKFETNSGNTSVLDKTAEESMPENRPSGVKTSQLAVPGGQESREELSRSSLMHSFAGDGTGLGISKNESGGQNVFSQSGNEQPVKVAQSVIMSKGEDVEKEKKREIAVVKEERDIGTTANAKNFEERMAMLEKRVEKIEAEKKALSQKWQELTGKTEEQGKMISSLSEDRNKMKEEIKSIKKSIGKGGGINLGNFESWHILLGMIIALILGAFVVRKSE